MIFEPFVQLLNALPWFAWIAIVAIICSTVSQAISKHYRHRERLEMIRQGVNPYGGKSSQPEV